MKTYTKEEYINWLNQQPDERPIRLGIVGNRDKECGCLGVEFFKDKGVKFDCVNSGGNIAHDLVCEETCPVAKIEDFRPFTNFCDNTSKNIFPNSFGELRKVYSPK